MNKNINIIVPMAGKGLRFFEAGYDIPKPFIKFKGDMMISHVLNNLPLYDNNLILVIQKKFTERYFDELSYLKKKYNFKYVSVNGDTAGAACTSLAVRESINKSRPVLFVDSDNIFTPNTVSNFLNDALSRNLDGSLLTFFSDSKDYSYVDINNDGFATSLREKEVISTHAVAGAYFFISYNVFEKNTIEMLIYGDQSKKEYYMSNVYNYLINDKGRVGIWEIKQNQFSCVGTPKQLETFLKVK